MKWLTFSWWSYLLLGCTSWTHFKCRAGGHKCGVIWFNVDGLEPDMRCRKCGDKLG